MCVFVWSVVTGRVHSNLMLGREGGMGFNLKVNLGAILDSPSPLLSAERCKGSNWRGDVLLLFTAVRMGFPLLFLFLWVALSTVFALRESVKCMEDERPLGLSIFWIGGSLSFLDIVSW